jgi:hypothetical protein
MLQINGKKLIQSSSVLQEFVRKLRFEKDLTDFKSSDPFSNYELPAHFFGGPKGIQDEMEKLFDYAIKEDWYEISKAHALILVSLCLNDGKVDDEVLQKEFPLWFFPDSNQLRNDKLIEERFFGVSIYTGGRKGGASLISWAVCIPDPHEEQTYMKHKFKKVPVKPVGTKG